MGRDTIKRLVIIVALCCVVHIQAKSLRKRRDVTLLEFPPPKGSFSRNAVESSPVIIKKSAALRDMSGNNDDYGTRRLPLRAAVESVPPKQLRLELTAVRVPMRDAVERRPPAYDDDLFSLTDELESLGIDPWSTDDNQQKKPDKYQEQPQSDTVHHQYLIELPANEREQYSQLHHQDSSHRHNDASRKMDYYGAAKPYNVQSSHMQHYAAYQPQYRLI